MHPPNDAIKLRVAVWSIYASPGIAERVLLVTLSGNECRRSIHSRMRTPAAEIAFTGNLGDSSQSLLFRRLRELPSPLGERYSGDRLRG